MPPMTRGTAKGETAAPPGSRKETHVDLEIVIPAYNEEHRIDRTLTAYRGHPWDRSVRFLVALDACTDRTADIVARHAAED
jgi:glycosyltransferase involved in cell wall biosynthesis